MSPSALRNELRAFERRLVLKLGCIIAAVATTALLALIR
jgi:hypothetical protein